MINRSLRIGIAQINLTVGDIEGNKRKILKYIDRAAKERCNIVVFPELSITGYPPQDLLLKTQFIEDNLSALHEIIKKTRRKDVVSILGFVDVEEDIYNSAAIIYKGELKGVYRKRFLPTYGVFDEDRYFKAGRTHGLFLIDGVKVGVNICEDIWYPDGPGWIQSLHGASVIINLSASPYYVGKREFRKRMISTRASDYASFIFYANLVGGQDELVFDGGSMVFDEEGNLISQGEIFEEDFIITDIEVGSVLRRRLHDPRRRKKELKETATFIPVCNREFKFKKKKSKLVEDISREEEILRALITGTRDYVVKNGFKKVIIGLSGGIDSALVAAISVLALGKENVMGVLMPSRFTSRQSIEDALRLSKNLGIKTFTVNIDDIFKEYLKTLKPHFEGRSWDSTEENIQARIRGNILMAFSNKMGYLVLTTGNKSEMSVGYATLYGDMAGGFAVIKDLLKTEVYRIASYINKREGREIIPESIIEKPPSAELRDNQRDEDELGPYKDIDPVIKEYIEEDRNYHEIVNRGHPPDLVKRVISMIDRSEYKRRQAPPGIRITYRSFGIERKLPITNRYKQWE